MSEKHFDVVVIGGGPAGYPAAIRAAQLGKSVACVDRWASPDGGQPFGGTCLNVGCIPSKALLESSELYHRAASEFRHHGIGTTGLSIDIAAMQARKQGIVKQLTAGIEALFKAAGVTPLRGHGRLLDGRRVEISAPSGDKQVIRAGHVILATGSTPIQLPFARFNGTTIVDSTGALEFDHVPERLGVIGAGVIGLELGSVWARLGAKVVLLEAMEEFLPAVDQQVAAEAKRQLERQGLEIRLGARVSRAIAGEDSVVVNFSTGDESHELTFDRLIVCVGRRPVSEDLFDDGLGVTRDDRGFIEVDEQCRTGADNVWAVGDVVRGPMLAHKATEEGVMVAELIAGEYAQLNYAAVPSVVYTAPEIAWVGKTEDEVRAMGIDYKVGTFSFAANGRAKALQQAAGLVKLIASREHDEILGVHIVGPVAGELIGEAVLAIEFQASAEDLQRTVHAHPSLSEALHEAALAADGHAIHAINR